VLTLVREWADETPVGVWSHEYVEFADERTDLPSNVIQMNWRTKIVDQYNYDSLMFSRRDAIGQLSEMDAVSNNLRAAGIMTDEELVARAVQASGARPIIITVLPVDRPVFPDAQSRVKALDAEIRGMAKKQGVTLLDAAGRFLKTHPLSALFRHADGREDGVHPSDAGLVVGNR
jgi:hypothetical protein